MEWGNFSAVRLYGRSEVDEAALIDHFAVAGATVVLSTIDTGKHCMTTWEYILTLFSDIIIIARLLKVSVHDCYCIRYFVNAMTLKPR